MHLSIFNLSIKSFFSEDPTVAKHFMFRAFAIEIAVNPMPLAPPWTSKDSLVFKFPWSNRLVHTVKNVSGIVQASKIGIPLGTGRTVEISQFTYSAYPPPVNNAHTFFPIKLLSIFFPISTMVPETSRPRISDAPFGGG